MKLSTLFEIIFWIILGGLGVWVIVYAIGGVF